jgi:hypothetical protein
MASGTGWSLILGPEASTSFRTLCWLLRPLGQGDQQFQGHKSYNTALKMWPRFDYYETDSLRMTISTGCFDGDDLCLLQPQSTDKMPPLRVLLSRIYVSI